MKNIIRNSFLNNICLNEPSFAEYTIQRSFLLYWFSHEINLDSYDFMGVWLSGGEI